MAQILFLLIAKEKPRPQGRGLNSQSEAQTDQSR
jgi:hypothetical protein